MMKDLPMGTAHHDGDQCFKCRTCGAHGPTEESVRICAGRSEYSIREETELAKEWFDKGRSQAIESLRERIEGMKVGKEDFVLELNSADHYGFNKALEDVLKLLDNESK